MSLRRQSGLWDSWPDVTLQGKGGDDPPRVMTISTTVIVTLSIPRAGLLGMQPI